MAAFSNSGVPFDNLDEQQEKTRRLISQLPPLTPVIWQGILPGWGEFYKLFF